MIRGQYIEILAACRMIRAITNQMARLRVTYVAQIQKQLERIEKLITDEIGQVD